VTTGSLVEQKHYIPAGSATVVYTMPSVGSSRTRYLHSDHLGSVDSVTDENGAVVQRLSFDSWGKRRNADWTDANYVGTDITRGYTGHDMDDEIGLIDMNARLYDPLLGRFISPDSIVDNMFGQGLNRYSYVENNPLCRIDPSGHSWKRLKKFVKKYGRVIVAAVVSYYTAGMATQFFASEIIGGAAAGFVAGGIAGGDMKSALTGAVTGGIGGAFGSTGMLGRAVGGGINGAIQARSSSGFLRGFASGLIPQDLGFSNAYKNNALANVSIGITRDGLRGYAVDGKDGIAAGIALGQVGNLVGHTVGLISTKFSAPIFKDGVFHYEGPYWENTRMGRGAITFGNVISGPPDLRSDQTLYTHERDHYENPVEQALGALYIPAHGLDLAVGWLGLKIGRGNSWFLIEEHTNVCGYSQVQRGWCD
jgi:RHS repeat-associated protein